MRILTLRGSVFKENGGLLKEFESEILFNEFISFLEESEYTFNGRTEITIMNNR